MGRETSFYAGRLRRELALRSRGWARGRLHVESYGAEPVVVFAPDSSSADGMPRHGNFFDAAYTSILARPEWMRRFSKVHAQAAHALPRPAGEPARRWRELDSSMSSDALLMNVFCTPGVVESIPLRNALGVDPAAVLEFGWKARVPLKSGLVDRTEVDLRLGSLLIEAKLTESDFQTRKAEFVEAYRDFDDVFDRDSLPRTSVRVGRRMEAIEFPENYSQEYEPIVEGAVPIPPESTPPVAVAPGYASYQLVRNVLAAYAHGCSFCVLHDERRPDLREAWFQVMAAVKSAEMRVRLKVLTWQELAAFLPAGLQDFLDLKYGIVAPGRNPSPWMETGPQS
ncbi:MAG TPA: hypothetical protein VGG62_03475 [Terracidiphilus sp.]|jgi:hypothetical protein